MKILIPIDGSDEALWAIKQAAPFIDKQSTVVYLFMVIVPVTAEVPWGFYLADEEEAGKVILARAESEAEGLGLKVVHKEYRTAHNPATAICDYASEKHADLILMGSHGYYGFEKFLMGGSVSEQVFKHAEQPVIVLRNDKDHTMEISHFDQVQLKPIC